MTLFLFFFSFSLFLDIVRYFLPFVIRFIFLFILIIDEIGKSSFYFYNHEWLGYVTHLHFPGSVFDPGAILASRKASGVNIKYVKVLTESAKGRRELGWRLADSITSNSGSHKIVEFFFSVTHRGGTCVGEKKKK